LARSFCIGLVFENRKYVSLVSQYIFRFGVQCVGVGVDEDQVPRADLLPFKFPEMVAQNFLNECRAGALRANLPINLGPNVS
jgi:hypothetical protein